MEVKKHREQQAATYLSKHVLMQYNAQIAVSLRHCAELWTFSQRQCVRAWDARPPAGGSPQQGPHWLPQPPHQQELPLPLSSLHSKSTICFQPNPNPPSILLAGFPTTFQKSKWACWPSLLLSSRPWQVMIISQHCLNTTKNNRGYTLPSENSFVWSWTVRWKG